MGRELTVSDHVTIAVSPLVAWEAVSDVTQMGRWSPENTGASVDTEGEVSVGTTFVGRNRRGPVRWATGCTVTTAAPGERFAFQVRRYGLRTPRVPVRIATWAYDFEPVEGGTRVTETWTDDRRWPDPVAAAFDRLATGTSFAQFQQGNIRRTLDRLKLELE
ncbi:SRPBCC family protein [Demetria terragena]|uniref:SRPBCC family protein n=1 Tax=Demetria terragena TaxID=63959 RepID=UPI00037624CF|nr:SRPBCC family protein [Demetria terragena]